MKKLFFLMGLVLCPFVKGFAQIPPELIDAIKERASQQIPVKNDSAKTDSTRTITTGGSPGQDSLLLLQRVKTLEAISVRAPRPIYSMDGEVVNYNVADDETVKGLT
ncbi:MAG: hypothetical protein J5641_06690, partial [Bacteroidales bacterium]|nr:hypothetical protein [Bacteroidales bacterium]